MHAKRLSQLMGPLKNNMSNATFSIPTIAASGLKELRKRLGFVFFAIIIYRIGTYIPVPGLDPDRLALLFNQIANNGFLGSFFNMLSGGAFSRFTLFAIGITPYISVSIIVQLLSTIVPSLEQLKKEGEAGRRQLNQYTRYGTAGLAIIESFSLTQWLVRQNVVIDPNIGFYTVAVMTLVSGALFLMWLGEQITERGIGNGVSLIIFAGIIAGLPPSLGQFLEQVRQGQVNLLTFILITITVIGVTMFVVFMERAQRKITVNYPQRQQGRRVYAAQTSHLPLKINMAGIMPTIFASSILMIPRLMPATLTDNIMKIVQTILDFFKVGEKIILLEELGLMLSPGKPLYILLFAIILTFLCFFYTALNFNPREMADNLKKSGAFIPGIRPGEQSAQYIDKVVTRLTAVGCIYLLLVVLLPDLMVLTWKVPFSFGGTSLLIVVLVIMEFIVQIQSLMMSHQYESLLKKAKLKGISTDLYRS